MPRWLKITFMVVTASIVLLLVALFALAWAYRHFRADPAANAATPALAAALPPGRIDVTAKLEAIRAKHKIPALAAVVLHGPDIVAQGAAGVRQAGAPERIAFDDRFHLGSDTKAMTATLVALLIERGQLRWDTTLGEIFGRSVPHFDPAWSNIAISELLTHRAGASANPDADGLWERLRQQKSSPREQRRQLVDAVLAQPPYRPPGTYHYSNTGYALAGAVTEELTGRPWEALMQDELFQPLGITTAGFGAPGTRDRIDQPRGHTALGKRVRPGPEADNPPAIAPAGEVHMTLADWAKFVALHLRGDAANPHRHTALLPPAAFDRLHRPADGPGERYAAGWIVAHRDWAKGPRAEDSGIVFTHTGSNTMWLCVTWLAPEKDIAVLVACNQGGPAAARACDEASAALLGAER